MAGEGDPVAPPCPECGGQAGYNGNYFCLESDCDWAFPHPDLDGPVVNSPELQAWGVKAYISLMRSRGETPDPIHCRAEMWRY